jgi:hypothetical protein
MKNTETELDKTDVCGLVMWDLTLIKYILGRFSIVHNLEISLPILPWYHPFPTHIFLLMINRFHFQRPRRKQSDQYPKEREWSNYRPSQKHQWLH